MKTKERLAEVLTKSGAPVRMIQKAKDGQYDDYESQSATPIGDLVRDLKKAKLHDLAKQAMDGAFDGSTEESAEWFEREGKDLL